MGKLMERLVRRHITWPLEQYQVIPDDLSGFRKRRSTSDAIAVISFALEEAKANRQAMQIVFLDVCRGYGSLPGNEFASTAVNWCPRPAFSFSEVFLDWYKFLRQATKDH